MKVIELIELLKQENPDAELVAKISANDSEAPVCGLIKTDYIKEVFIDVGLW